MKNYQLPFYCIHSKCNWMCTKFWHHLTLIAITLIAPLITLLGFMIKGISLLVADAKKRSTVFNMNRGQFVLFILCLFAVSIFYIFTSSSRLAIVMGYFLGSTIKELGKYFIPTGAVLLCIWFWKKNKDIN